MSTVHHLTLLSAPNGRGVLYEHGADGVTLAATNGEVATLEALAAERHPGLHLRTVPPAIQRAEPAFEQ